MERREVRLDPAVEAVLGDGARRGRRRRMTRRERAQAERDSRRQRVTLELNPELVGLVRRVGEHEGLSPAGVVNVLLLDGLRRYAGRELGVDEYVRPSQGPRYDWVVEVEVGDLGERVERRMIPRGREDLNDE